jgi:hypothetical protein
VEYASEIFDKPAEWSVSEAVKPGFLAPTQTVVSAGPPAGQRGVPIMEGERVVFTEESDPQRYVKLIANGEVDETLLDALAAYVERQRKRLERAAVLPKSPE